MTKIVVIGAGFSGLATACCLAKKGFQVSILEKNNSAGGRARRLQQSGYTFDMGPSWYWMPDVFDEFFEQFGQSTSDFYHLERLDPSYQMFFSANESLDIPAGYRELRELFESIEPGASHKLDEFLEQARIKYEVGMHDLVFKPGTTYLEFFNLKTLKGALRLNLLQSFYKHVRHFFQDPRLIQILTFPILFLGASAKDTPALYSLMNYADLKLGTWYPKSGMYKIVEALVTLAESLGVEIHYQQEVEQINISAAKATGVKTSAGSWDADVVVASADYHFVEKNCLPAEYQSYTTSYWESRTMAPSSLIYYLGISKKIPGLQHHNLFFDEDLEQHTREIYQDPQWPTKPLFYVSVTSKTDETVCPPGHENLFILIPVAPGLEDTESSRMRYFEMVLERMEARLGTDIRSSIVYKKSYAHRDFIQDYHAFKGNAYGLANTVGQTAFLKPKIRSKKVSNLFYTGQLTVPGPGVPPSLISGQIVASEIIKETSNEAIIR